MLTPLKNWASWNLIVEVAVMEYLRSNENKEGDNLMTLFLCQVSSSL